jgi:hypothetical protein
VKQRHDPHTGHPICGACPAPVLPGEPYLVARERSGDDVDADPSVMVHLDHFRAHAVYERPVEVSE